jgi:putative tryptophan/tyrosine transport system permease protein
MELWIGALNLGFLYAFMAMGVFITFRIHDFPDITVDGSFVTGAAVTAVLIVAGVNPFLALALSFLAGAAAGVITASIHTRFNINGLLAGILVMTGLYSINLHIMGRSNIPLLSQPGVITSLRSLNPGLHDEIWLSVVFCAALLVFWLAVSFFFKTDFGITMRAVGNNPAMASASGVNVNAMKTVGIALANGLVGVSGSLVAQYQGFADIGMGIGSIVFGLAAVIIGESIIRTRSVYGKALSVIIGSIAFRVMVALALYVGLNPIDLKLITALFVLVILVAPRMLAGRRFRIAWSAGALFKTFPARKILVVLAVAVCVAAGSAGVWRLYTSRALVHSEVMRIGVVQFTDHGLLNITRDSFVEEMKKLGYENGKNVIIDLQNANGDMTTVNTIIDKFLHDKADIVVPISTGCTQAAMNKVKRKPIVFATVANPFMIGAGKTETDHLPNVTGVYGTIPGELLLSAATRILPGKIKVGAIWDPSQENSVYSLGLLRGAIAKNPRVTFVGATVSGSSEVYQAATSLTNQGINAFVLSTDNIVFSAFESVVKAADAKKIPIIMSDVEHLKDGALATYGYDYTLSGIQAARMVDRIIKGEKPGRIPFERYTKVSLGINTDVAKKLGITVPPDMMAQAAVVYSKTKGDGKPKRLALFTFSETFLLMESVKGINDELTKSGVLKEHNMTITVKNAHNDYGTSQAIVQDMVRQNFDYIVTVSSLALQATANGNKKIPHIFGTVTDPYRMGVAKSPKDHIPNITGIATFQPVEITVKAMRAVFPGAKRVGIIWNPSEANSEACTQVAREMAKKYGFELVERTVTSTDEVKDALAALLNKDIDLFFTSGDTTVTLAVQTIANILKERKIPYFTNDPTDVGHGAFLSIGADYYEVGVETAKVAERVIRGEQPRDIPIRNFVPEKIGVNAGLAALYGVAIPDSLLKKAAIVKRR